LKKSNVAKDPHALAKCVLEWRAGLATDGQESHREYCTVRHRESSQIDDLTRANQLVSGAANAYDKLISGRRTKTS
jgi:hypothetical protein